MESSSNDSFLWTDASNDSNSNRNESVSSPKHQQSKDNTNLQCENETKKKAKSSKKRKYSESSYESCDYTQPEKKRIKVESESDVDFEKKKLAEDHVHNSDAQDSNLSGEEYLNLKVKEEQSSLLLTKQKKKKKKSSSSTDYVHESVSYIEQCRESDLDLRVKQEQESVTEPEIKKSKKKKKSTVSSDMDIVSETKSVVTLEETTAQEHSSMFDEGSNYSIIEEKFCAEETVVNKRTKKKDKANTITEDREDDKDSMYIKKDIRMTPEMTPEIDNNDMTLQPSDFTCNNIVSSTIINSSSVDFMDKQINKIDKSLCSKNIETTKISDRIRFEEDDNSSQQGSLFDITSDTMTNFLKRNPHLKPCTSVTPKDILITKNDEFWALIWPYEVGLEKFRNATLSSEGKHKIKIDGQSYDLISNDDETTITLGIHDHGQTIITKLPLINCMNSLKRIPKVHIHDHNIMVNDEINFIPLPETKCRHPLFGARYKKAIKMSSAVVERLEAAKGQCSETRNKSYKKKHKKDKQKLLSVKEEEADSGGVMKPGHESVMNNKKRKNSQDINSGSKKRKRVKHRTDSSTVWESEKAIEENLFNF